MYLSYPPLLSQILCFSSPSDSNPQFPETFLAMQLPPVLFWGDANEDLYKSPKKYFNQSKDKHAQST